MTRFIWAASVLFCTGAIALAFHLLSFGTGWSDDTEAIAYFLLGIGGGFLAALDYGFD